MPSKSLLASIISVVITSLVAAGGAQAAQDASPVATPAGSPPLIETLVATTFPADTIPATSSRSFLIWHATIAPGTEVAIPADLVACCPGPQIEHVLAGELTFLVEGPLQVVRGAPEGTLLPVQGLRNPDLSPAIHFPEGAVGGRSAPNSPHRRI